MEILIPPAIEENGETYTLSVSPRRSCYSSFSCSHAFSTIKSGHFYMFVVGTYGRLNFFIQQRLIHDKETKEARYDHYKRLVSEVFDKWIRISSELSENRIGYKNSFMKLYVNIVDDLKEPIRYSRAKSHLQYDGYSEARTLLESIETKSKAHNDTVNGFMESLESDIISSISESNINIRQFANSDVKRGYALDRILSHYKKEAHGYHSTLRVDSFGPNEFTLHRQDDNSTVIARDSDRSVLENLSQILGGELQTKKVDKLRNLSKDGKYICLLYQDKFVPEIKNIITEFEDEKRIHGGCN
jgi:hypothetical protein